MSQLNKPILFLTSLFLFFGMIAGNSDVLKGQNLDEWRYTNRLNPKQNAIVTKDQFNGYLNFWTNEYWKWIQYGNLFPMSLSVPENEIVQNKLDMTAEMGILGFWMEEGFLDALLSDSYSVLETPSLENLLDSTGTGNLLILVDSRTPLGKKLESKLPKERNWEEDLKSYQFQSEDYISAKAFYLENGKDKLFVILSESSERRAAVKELVDCFV